MYKSTVSRIHAALSRVCLIVESDWLETKDWPSYISRALGHKGTQHDRLKLANLEFSDWLNASKVSLAYAFTYLNSLQLCTHLIFTQWLYENNWLRENTSFSRTLLPKNFKCKRYFRSEGERKLDCRKIGYEEKQ